MCGFSLPVMVANLFLYISTVLALGRRNSSTNSARDAALTKAFMLLSISWMVLWFPKTVFSVYYAFIGTKITFYDVRSLAVSVSEFRKNFVVEFVVLQLSYLFSSVNSIILIVLIRGFQLPLKKLLGRLKNEFGYCKRS